MKIIWAVDPSAGASLQRTAIVAIKALARGRRATVQPVYFLTTFLDSTPSQTSGDALGLTRTAAVEKFSKIPGLSRLTGLQPLIVLPGFTRSVKHKAARLLEYARAEGADTIAVASHGRKGLEKWFLGSFADSLMQQSEIPILIVNPHWRKTSHFKSVLFPTDFSPESKDAFLKVVAFARSARLPITLFHSVPAAILPEDARTLRAAIADRKALATRWVLEAKRHGARAIISVAAHGTSSVAESILSYQKRKGGIIALGSRGRDTAPLSIGRTTRAVVQSSTSPVWVLYPPETGSIIRAAKESAA